MITAIVLAAGESRRMQRPKPLLTIGGETFIRRIIDVFTHPAVERTVVVLGAHADAVRKELDGLDVTVIVNEQYHLGQLSSLVAGIAEAERIGSSGVIVHPVDHPLISRQLVDSLIAPFREERALIVVPVFNGKRGHPVLFSSQLFGELRVVSPSVGARAVVWKHRDETLEVRTDDEGCVLDIDTIDDYEKVRRVFKGATVWDDTVYRHATDWWFENKIDLS